jgi:hypothetical protein
MPFVSFDSDIPVHWGVVNVPATRRPMRPQCLGVYAKGTLPTDSIGTFVMTLTNVVVGSAIRVEVVSTGELIEYRVATSSTEVFNVPAYSSGSSANELRIKVRKASAAPMYKPYETQATAVVGAQSVFIAQIPD